MNASHTRTSFFAAVAVLSMTGGAAAESDPYSAKSLLYGVVFMATACEEVYGPDIAFMNAKTVVSLNLNKLGADMREMTVGIEETAASLRSDDTMMGYYRQFEVGKVKEDCIRKVEKRVNDANAAVIKELFGQ